MENKGIFSVIAMGFLALIVLLALILSGCTIQCECNCNCNHIQPTAPVETTIKTELTEPTETSIVPTEPTGPRKLSLEEVESFCKVDAEMLAKVVYGEAGGCSLLEREKVIWCVLNRVDDPRFGNTVFRVVTAQSQFHGYSPDHPIIQENYELALEVISKWLYEKEGGEIERPLGPEYLYFSADASGMKNNYRTDYWTP